MANIIQDAGGLKYVAMQNARFARTPLSTLFDGGAWNVIRVCLSVVVEDSGANIGGTPVFAFGLCSGTTNIPGDATPTNAIGASSNAVTWNRQPAAGFESYTLSHACFKNVAGSQTISGSLGNPSSLHMNTYVGSVAHPLFINIAKGSPNFTMRLFYMSNVFAFSMTEAQYIAQSIATTPAFSGMQYPAGTTMAFSEADGALDSAFVYFNVASGLRILDWRVIRIS